ncbi:hypothetical protein DH2020_009851 [Rehmannia glutinosa]|uniref:Protein kinase domain-containing protein n=1 Tax=Rehmannia glutinosa TaxID=99300 RepID=A0ABR0X7G9_REHGL
MSRNYDNWERLVAAVLRRELIWKLCHENSRTPSLRSSVSSDSSFRLSSSFSSTTFDFVVDQKHGFFKSAKFLPFQYLAEIKISASPETKEEEDGRLIHLKGSSFAFGLQELLMAPSFVLGEELATYRNTYIIRLKEDTMFVVKKLERDHFTEVEFKNRVKTIGSIEHENVVKLRGYYLSQNESLGFFDYFPQGSVYTMLHGKRSENRVHLDWDARIRIAIGAAKGLAHIHKQNNGKYIYGNMKASNIFLNSQEYGCVADRSPGIARISKYQPPEVSKLQKLSQASDVYSFGVLMIEIVSGRSPLHYIGRHKTFVDWAIHNARDEWTAIVFDRGLLKDPLVKQEMWDMLGVALSCVKKKPEERPNMEDVVKMLESIPTNFPI